MLSSHISDWTNLDPEFPFQGALQDLGLGFASLNRALAQVRNQDRAQLEADSYLAVQERLTSSAGARSTTAALG
jgi:hypothetical protein